MTQLYQNNSGEDAEWVLLFTSDKAYEQEILKSLLENEEVPAIIVNKRDSAYLIFGDIELYVLREDLLKAKQILTRFNEQK